MTDEELYDSMIDNEFSISTINQILKAKEAGYDLYNHDIRISNDKLREFRKFIMENFPPIFTHDQLREMQIGFIHGVDIFKYADEKYSKAEMEILRKGMEKGLDIELIKEFAHDERTMRIYSTALFNGFTRKDFEQYDEEEIKLINDCFKKKIDVRKYVDLGYPFKKALLLVNNLLKYKIDLSQHLTPAHNENTYEEYIKLLSKFKKEDIISFFDDRFTKEQLYAVEMALMDNHKNIQECITHISNPEYGGQKILFIGEQLKKGIKKENLEIIKNSNLVDSQYYDLRFLFTHNKFDERFFSVNIPSKYFQVIKFESKLDVDYFLDLVKKEINPGVIRDMLRLHNECCSIDEYVDKDTPIARVLLYQDCIRFIKKHNLWKDEKYLMETLDDSFKLKIAKTCIEKGVDFNKLNLNLYESQINFVINNYPHNLEISHYLTKTKNMSQMNALLKAIDEGLPQELLLIPDLDSFKYGMILQLEKFNQENERKINIMDIITLDADVKTIGKIISNLTSKDLERNLQAYADINKINKITVKPIEKTMEER